MIVRAKNGDTISVIVSLDPSVFDPSGAIAAVGQSYRVVANVDSHGSVLELVPLGRYPVQLSRDGENIL